MKKFLYKLFLFIGLITIISSCVCCILYINRYRIIDYRLHKDARIVFIGNSMVECSVIDDSLYNCQNVAKSAKQYLFALIDLREILLMNPQVDTVILGCSPFTLMETQADDEYQNDAYIESVNYYAPFLNAHEYAILPKITPFIKFNFGMYGLRYLFFSQKPGAYLFNTRHNLQNAINSYKKKEVIEPFLYNNDITIYSLRSIKEICRKHGVKLLFLSPPIWNAKDFYDLEYYHNLMHKYLTDNDELILDYTELQLPDSCYADLIHLNHYGAEQFTQFLKKRLGR